MDLGLDDKVALVTAASKGLGRAVASRLAEEGAHVAICARGEEHLAATSAEIEAQTDRQVLPIQADVSNPKAADALVKATIERFGRLDILVTSAGGPPPGQFLDLTPEDWETAVRLTLMSAVRLLYTAVPVMQEQGEGSILAITSVTVKQPLPNLVLSNSLRLSIIGLIKTLADELAPFGIRVNGICPGWTRTDRVDQLLRDRATRKLTTAEEEAAQIAIDIPMGRMGTPEEFARAAAFLVSPAASYITGVSLLVDGGMYRGIM
jgi:3-oxoacyl-[acyl-carrier protein] reductase